MTSPNIYNLHNITCKVRLPTETKFQYRIKNKLSIQIFFSLEPLLEHIFSLDGRMNIIIKNKYSFFK